MRRHLLIALPVLALLALSASPAQAVVVDMNAVGQNVTSVPYSNLSQGGYYGVALVPGTRTAPSTTTSALALSGVPFVKSSVCADPALTPDLALPGTGLCYHHGSVLSRYETFALTWDPLRRYWSGTRNYVEQFLRAAADASGTLTSPYAVTTQYRNSSKASAGESSRYGGGCIDYGNPNGMNNKNTTCLFGSSVQTGPGYNYPANGCVPTGSSFTFGGGDGFSPNDRCLTDAEIRSELKTIVTQMGILNRTQPGYSPMVVLPLPPRVEACLTSKTQLGGLCSVNGSITAPAVPVLTMSSAGGVQTPFTDRVEITYVTATGESMPSNQSSITIDKADPTLTVASPPAATGVTGWYAYVSHNGGPWARLQSSPSAIGTPYQWDGSAGTGASPPSSAFFCSYHGHMYIGGRDVAYVVQPWSAMTQCDEPDVPKLPQDPPPTVLSQNVGMRLVSPLSQAQMAAIVNPRFTGWFALNGEEMNDHGGCIPAGDNVDKVRVGSASYLLQHEFNNAWVMNADPFTYFGCAPDVVLTPNFVVPSPIDQGEVVGFDGSATASTLIVPNADYRWSFGDGTTGTGPSMVHTFAKSGFYHVKLTVTDRGGNVRILTRTVEVLGADGQPPKTGGNPGGGNPGGGPTGPTQLRVHLQLLPQSLKAVLRSGLAVRVSSNEAANGFATLSILRSVAHRAHLSSAGNPKSLVVIGRGTVSGIKDGTVSLHVRVSSATAKKLAHTGHLTLTLHMRLMAKNGARTTASTVGRY
jgi:hypothetical protein